MNRIKWRKIERNHRHKFEIRVTQRRGTPIYDRKFRFTGHKNQTGTSKVGAVLEARKAQKYAQDDCMKNSLKSVEKHKGCLSWSENASKDRI